MKVVNQLPVFAMILLCSCGGGPEAPVLSEITMVERSIGVGDQLFATVLATDQDGDFDRGRMLISVESDDGETSLESTESVVEVEPGTTSASLTVGLRLFGGDLSRDRYTLELVLVDNEDLESEPAVDHFELTR